MNNKNTAEERRFKKQINFLKKSIGALQDDINYHDISMFVSTADMIFRYLDDELQKSGLNRTKFGILLTLVNQGGISTPTQLSNELIRSKYTITGAVDSLEKEGLAKRIELNSDKRSDRRLRKVSITQQGLDVLQNSMSINSQRTSSMMRYFNKENAHVFESNIALLQKNEGTISSY